MKRLITASSLAVLVALGGIYASQDARAQSNQPCVGENCPGADMRNNQGQTRKLKGTNQNNQMQGSDENQMDQRRKKRVQSQQNDNVDVDVRARAYAGDGKWRFDPNRHHRRSHKNATFRFYYGGYWYPQPYWEIVSVRPRYRISCGEGRAIVSERYNRVRVVECNGGTYTYLGRRQGDTYRVLLNARTGRIVGRALI